MGDGAMSVAVFSALVAAVTVIAAMSLLGAVALMYSSSRRQGAPRRYSLDPHEGHGAGLSYDTQDSHDTQDTLDTRDRHWAPPVRRDPPSDPADRPTTPMDEDAAPTRLFRPHVLTTGPQGPQRPGPPQQGFFAEEEGEEYGLSTFDPVLRRAVGPLADWADEDGSTEIFSAHIVTDAEYAFADFEDSPTRLGAPDQPPGPNSRENR
jgi:hypothetical protein